ncbi:MAG: DUF1707 SHOCT-like domain-containing protein [Acidimicrobiales bacterium]
MTEPQDDLGTSDTERQRVVDQLRRHMTDGRLSFEEFENRTGVAYRARSPEELARLTSDLPPGPLPAGPVTRPRPARPQPPSGQGAALMSIPAFRVHLFLWLVFSAFWMVIWLGSVMATGGWVPFWPCSRSPPSA